MGGQSKHSYNQEGLCYRVLGVQGKRFSFSYMIESDNYDQAVAASSLGA